MATNIPKNALVAGAAVGAALGAAALGAVAVAATGVCKQIAHTRSGRARVAEINDATGRRVRVLAQGGVYQSATYIDEHRFEPVFQYYRSFDAMFAAEPAMREQFGHGITDVLMLGGGGFSYPKWALTQHPRLRMDVVEYDGTMIKLAERWFYLNDLKKRAAGRLRVVQADARASLELNAIGTRRYGAVINDCFCGNAPVQKLATAEALALVKKCLQPGGLYLANIVAGAAGEDVEFLRNCIATAHEVFSHVQIIDAADDEFAAKDNYLLIASDGDYYFDNAFGYGEEMYGQVLHDPKEEGL